ncbi:MAG: glycosyltransferase, partial [Chloroflexi bacterium]|nr:glycosyltransferase [Chloroflexota bacterium]
MNILFATDVFPPQSGGSGWSTFYLARALAQRGHRVQVALPKLGIVGTQTRVYEGLTVVEVGYRASNVPGLRAWQRTRALEKTFSAYLAECAREFDVLHAQHVLSISAAVAAKKIARVPVVSTVRDYWTVCLYGTLWRDEAICPICRGGEITRCLKQKYRGAANFMQPVVPLVERELRRRQRALQQSDAVIAVSDFVAGTLRGIVPEKTLRVVPNLIDVEETQQIADGGWQMADGVKSETACPEWNEGS